ncbi:hypothetical protein HPB47_027985 [Ixodes persulcatus]|uniref:Uncharacterized protein n=1 Tax=Ixodes persulcatus TaxID=34615 RepID=A0AC60PWU4_IXOPE|nr:hypothetical protein HPB47_027985 [Ixodes persulcatus]
MKDLSDEATLCLIALVEEFPQLWCLQNDQYRNNGIKLELWKQIANEMERRYSQYGPYTEGPWTYSVTFAHVIRKIHQVRGHVLQWKYLRDKYAKEAAKVAGTERSGFGTSDVCKPNILVFKWLPRCWVDREAKGRRLLLNHLLARDVRQMADVVLINPHPFFLNREKAPKREYFTADGYHIHRILGVRKMSKLIKVHVKKKLGAQWIGVRHCLELPQIYSCSHCTLVQPLQDKRPQVVVVPQLHPPPITMPASHRLPANDTILAVPDLPNRMTGEGL